MVNDRANITIIYGYDAVERLRSCNFFRSRLSPSASHLLAFTIWMTFMYCFITMTGAAATVKIHGTVLSILFALAISIAAAEKGDGKRRDGMG